MFSVCKALRSNSFMRILLRSWNFLPICQEFRLAEVCQGVFDELCQNFIGHGCNVRTGESRIDNMHRGANAGGQNLG